MVGQSLGTLLMVYRRLILNIRFRTYVINDTPYDLRQLSRKPTLVRGVLFAWTTNTARRRAAHSVRPLRDSRSSQNLCVFLGIEPNGGLAAWWLLLQIAFLPIVIGD